MKGLRLAVMGLRLAVSGWHYPLMVGGQPFGIEGLGVDLDLGHRGRISLIGPMCPIRRMAETCLQNTCVATPNRQPPTANR